MQASVGGGISGAAARAAGPESLSPRERPENVRIERVLRASDGLGFCRSSLAGRRVNPTPELAFQYKEREREREREHRSVRPALDPRAKVFIPRAEREEREGKESVRSFVSACDDDNVSVSTDASCFSDLSLESVHTPSQDLLRWGNTTVYKNKRGGSIVHIYEYDPEDEVPVHDLQDLLQEQQLRQQRRERRRQQEVR